MTLSPGMTDGYYTAWRLSNNIYVFYFHYSTISGPCSEYIVFVLVHIYTCMVQKRLDFLGLSYSKLYD